MKKSILLAVLVSIVITASAYYYFFIMNAQDETTALPSKVKIAIKMPETASTGKAIQKETKEVKQKELKQQEPQKVDKKKEEPKKVEEKKTESKKEEPKKTEVKKEVEKAEKELPKETKPQKKIIGYKLIYKVVSEEEANSIKEKLIANGYHTAKKVSDGKRLYVVVAPFTDKWEAEYVRTNISKETQINFSVTPVYR